MKEQSAASHGSKDVYKYGYVDVSTPGSPGSTTPLQQSFHSPFTKVVQGTGSQALTSGFGLSLRSGGYTIVWPRMG